MTDSTTTADRPRTPSSKRPRAASVWSWLALAGVAGAQAVQSIRAAVGGGTSAVWDVALGAGPNFFAALAISFFGPALAAWRGGHASDGQWFAGSATLALVGLVGWETLQTTGRLVFDPADVVATVFGVALAAAVFGRRSRRPRA